MGISFYIIWKRGIKSKEEKNAVYIFFVQLILNALWSFLFFGLRSPFLGFVCIIFLWFSIALTIWKFWRLEKISGILLLPYIGWVSFASILNFFVWILN
jgi:tryptophan-rich sensory protein